MRCLVINLDRSPDRLAHVSAEFGRIGIAFERVAAVDALRRPDLSEMTMRTEASLPWRLADTEIGCLLSHRACWSMIAMGDDAHAAVFEDDIVFAAKAGALLADSSWVPADAGIVKLETVFHRTLVGLLGIGAGHGFSAKRLHGLHLGCAGYIVSKRTAAALIEATSEIGIPVDHVLFDPEHQPAPGWVGYQLSPALCTQLQFVEPGTDRLPSLIQPDRETRYPADAGGERPRRSTATRVKREIGRLLRRLDDLRHLRRPVFVPFDHDGKRIRRPHTQRPENTL
jgi:glycosyl transferase family 25